jgi:hypothetical protein
MHETLFLNPFVKKLTYHDQINEVADSKVTPDSKVVIHFHLSNWHPLEVSSNRVRLTLVHAHAPILDE